MYADEIVDVSRVSVRQTSRREFLIRFARPITAPDDFSEEFQALANAGPDDLVRIHFMTPGGSLDTTLMLQKAVRECAATVIGHIGMECASGGTAVALACDGWEVDDMSGFMIHTATFGVGREKTRNVVASAEWSQRMIEKFVDLTYTGFLTEQELEVVKEGKDMYFDGDDLANRLEDYHVYRVKMAEKEVEEALEELSQLPGELEDGA